MTVLGKKKLKVWSYVFEFFVLFGSIYIAFELEEWDENQDFTDREVAYLASMYQDLSKDLNQLNRRVIEYDEKIQSADRVLDLLEEPYPFIQQQVSAELKSHLFTHFNYNPVNNTVMTLKTSGDLKLLKNHEFKILLSELDKSHVSTMHQGEIFNSYIEGNEWSGFFINNFNIRNFESISQDPNFSILFRNRLRHYIALAESYYFHMQGSLKKTEEVKLALEEEMSRRDLSESLSSQNDNSEESELDMLNDELDDLFDDLGSSDTISQDSNEEELDLDADSDSGTDYLLEELEKSN